MYGPMTQIESLTLIRGIGNVEDIASDDVEIMEVVLSASYIISLIPFHILFLVPVFRI